MAETRALDRSVPRSQIDFRSGSALIGQISDARVAVGSDDRARAIQILDTTWLL